MKQIMVTSDLATVGLRVMRGKHWCYENQDCMNGDAEIVPGLKPGGPGTITKIEAMWATVKWDSGHSNDYCIDDVRPDLYVYNPMGSVDESKTEQKTTEVPGAIVTWEMTRVGLEVMRGPDWTWGDQDTRMYGGKMGSGKGVISRRCSTEGWVGVKWDNGFEGGIYRAGFGKYDLRVYDPRTAKVQDMRNALEQSLKRTEEKYGESLKPNKNDNDRTTVYSGNCLYLPSKTLTLQRGERPEGRRLQS